MHFLKPLRLVLGLALGGCDGYDYFNWDVEPTIDFNADPGLARTVYFVHMRKAAGTAVRQFFREVYQKLQCLPPKERKLVHSDQSNWRCDHLAFYHVEWHCLVGSDILRIRRAALESGEAPAGLELASPMGHFYAERKMKFITCLRHPIDRLISIHWYGESSHGMKYMKELHRTGGIGTDAEGNDLSVRPEGEHKRTWYRNSVDIAKKMAATNSTLWNGWLHQVDQSTVWNYYTSRLQGGSCLTRDKGCLLATRCLAVGPGGPVAGGGGGGSAASGIRSSDLGVDPEHPHGCRALFSNDWQFPKPKFGQARSRVPEIYGVETPAPLGRGSPLARWVDRALGQPCAKHSHSVVHFQNRSRHDLEDAKLTLAMFDAVRETG